MGRKKKSPKGYLEANRQGSRDAELENSTGFKAVHKVHKSKKDYNRRDNKNFNDDDEI